MKLIILIGISIFSFQIMAQKKYVNPNPVGYSDAVKVKGGKTIYISGQVPINARNELVGKGNLHEQTIQVFENIKNVLSLSGATFADVVKINTYIVDCKPEHVALVREVRKSYLSAEKPPASTMVGVTSLVDPDFLIEIEAIAVVE
jgi:reactive intermediate/imine deaminase